MTTTLCAQRTAVSHPSHAASLVVVHRARIYRSEPLGVLIQIPLEHRARCALQVVDVHLVSAVSNSAVEWVTRATLRGELGNGSDTRTREVRLWCVSRRLLLRGARVPGNILPTLCDDHWARRRSNLKLVGGYEIATPCGSQ